MTPINDLQSVINGSYHDLFLRRSKEHGNFPQGNVHGQSIHGLFSSRKGKEEEEGRKQKDEEDDDDHDKDDNNQEDNNDQDGNNIAKNKKVTDDGNENREEKGKVRKPKKKRMTEAERLRMASVGFYTAW